MFEYIVNIEDMILIEVVLIEEL